MSEYTEHLVTPTAHTQAEPGLLRVQKVGHLPLYTEGGVHPKSFSHLTGVSQHAEGAHRSGGWQGVSHNRRVSVAASPGSLLQGVCDLFPHSRKGDLYRTSQASHCCGMITLREGTYV